MRKWLKNPFLTGSLIFTFTSFIASLLNYAVNFLVARHLSLSFYGEYMTATAYFMFFAIPIGAISTVLIKKIGSQSSKKRYLYILSLERYFLNQLKQYFWLAVLLTLILFLILSGQSHLNFISALFVLAMIILSLTSTLYNSALQISKKFLLVGSALILVALVKIIGVSFTIQINPSLTWLYLVILLASFVGFLFLLVTTHQLVKTAKPLSTNQLYKFQNFYFYLRKKSILVPFFTTLGMAGLITADVMSAKIFLNADRVGLYAGLSLLAKIILYFTTPITLAAYAFFSTKEHTKHQNKNLVLAIILFLLVGGVSFLVYKYFANTIITLVFGVKFLSLSPIIWLSAIYGLIYSLTSLFSRFIIAKNSWFGLASLVAVVIQIILISLFHQNISQIMQINILVVGGLLLFYSIFVIFNWTKSR